VHRRRPVKILRRATGFVKQAGVNGSIFFPAGKNIYLFAIYLVELFKVWLLK
jgi:hypothetical protein